MRTEAADLDRAWAWLDMQERAAAQRLIFEQDRQDYIAAHGLRRATLAQVLDREPSDFRFSVDQPRGKPRLLDWPRSVVDLNLTHTRGLSACVVGLGYLVGIDAERSDRRVSDALLSEFCGVQEIKALRASDSLQRLRTWCAKEALAKAYGEGLGFDFKEFVLDAPTCAPLQCPPGMEPAPQWRVQVWQATAEHVAALAFRVQDGLEPEVDVAWIDARAT